MNKILFSLLVSGVFFGGIESAMAVRTMNHEGWIRKSVLTKNGVHKPAPHMEEQQRTQKISKEVEKLVQSTVETFNVNNGGVDKENSPKGFRKFQIHNGQVFTLSNAQRLLPCIMTAPNQPLHELSVTAVPVTKPFATLALVLPYLTRSQALKSR